MEQFFIDETAPLRNANFGLRILRARKLFNQQSEIRIPQSWWLDTRRRVAEN
jgi:hypothetical protein